MRPGEAIAERYEVIRPAKSGAAGIVFEAFDRETRRRVAVKLISLVRQAPLFAQRIEREIAILTSLVHPHVVAYQGAGTLADGRLYVVLEWLEGRDLAEALLQGPLPRRVALELAAQVAEALAAAHALGIVHRDVKPANVFLLHGRGEVFAKVLDFGVAKAEPGDSAGLTHVGALLGTPAYMAPEQASTAADVDGRADIFSLGVVLFELLTGELPWSTRSDLARIARIHSEQARPLARALPEVTPGLARLVDAMLALRVEARPATMTEVARTLRALKEGLAPRLRGLDPPPLPPPDPAEATATDPVPEGTIQDERTPGVVARTTSSSAPPPIVERISAGERGDGMSASSLRATMGMPLVGRSTLLDRLVALATVWTRVESASPRPVAVVGAAGLGKTRLRHELAQRLARARGAIRTTSLRADPSLRSTPYGVLRRLALHEAGVGPSDDPAVALQKLDAWVPRTLTQPVARSLAEASASTQARWESETRTIVADVHTGPRSRSVVVSLAELSSAESPLDSVEERAMLVALLAFLLGLRPTLPEPLTSLAAQPAMIAREARRLWQLLLEALSAERPWLLLIDDAHDLDRASARVLRELTPGTRLRVFAFGQPAMLDEPAEGRAPWRPAQFEQVEVPPLELAHARALARRLASGPLETGAQEQLVARADGSPLFLEQLVRALLETGVLGPGPSGDLALIGLRGDERDADRVPGTVAQAVRARLGALPPELREVLEVATAFGDVCWAEGVAELLSLDLEETMARIDRLVLADWLRPRSTSRFRGASELDLSHAVVQTVVGSQLPRPRRRAFADGVARFLLAHGEGPGARLAEQVLRAGAREPAARILRQAGRHALAVGDLAAAQSLAEEGLRVAEGLPPGDDPRVGLHEVLELAHAQAGELAAASSAARMGAARCGSAVRRAGLWLRAARYDLERGDARAAEQALEASERGPVSTSVPDAPPEALDGDAIQAAELARTILRGRLAEHRGDDRQALRVLLGVEQALADGNERALRAETLIGLGELALRHGELRLAETRLRAALVEARASHELELLRAALVRLAQVAALGGDVELAEHHLDAHDELSDGVLERCTSICVRAELHAELAPGSRDPELRVEAALETALAAGHTVRVVRALLTWGRLASSTRDDVPPDAARVIAERLDWAAEQARQVRPVWSSAIDLSLGLLRLRAGSVAEGLTLVEGVARRFEVSGALAEEEPPRLFLALADARRAAERDAASVHRAEVHAARAAVAIAQGLDREHRRLYVQRPLLRRVLALGETSAELSEELAPLRAPGVVEETTA